MKSIIHKGIKGTLLAAFVAGSMSLTGCAVRVAPATPVVVHKKHVHHRNCVHRKRPVRRHVVVVR